MQDKVASTYRLNLIQTYAPNYIIIIRFYDLYSLLYIVKLEEGRAL
jgi:hypothetical protein